MIFSIINWNDAEELNRFIPVSAGLSFEKVESSLEDAWRIFILPLLGEELCARIQSIYDAYQRDASDEELLQQCQRAIANIAFWNNYDELNVRISDIGMMRQESAEGTFKPTFKYQEDRLRQTFRNKGFNALDLIIDYLQRHKDRYPEYLASPAYAERLQAIVRTTDEVDRACFINHSHLIFLRLKPIFRRIEEHDLAQQITEPLYDTLMDALSSDEQYIGNIETESLRMRCADYVIFKAVATLIRETGSLNDRGLYFTRLSEGDGNVASSPADKDQSADLSSIYEQYASRALSSLQHFIRNYLPEFFGGCQSQVLLRDNTDKRTVWL